MNDPEHGVIIAGQSLAPRKNKVVPLAIAVIVVLVVSCGGILLRRAEGGVNQVALDAEPKAVAVVEAKAATFRPTKRYIGTLEPWLSARVGPQLAAGFVDTVLVRPGATVKRGEVLATLDCRSSSAGNQAIAQQARALEARQKAAAREATRLGELLDGGYASANEVEQKQAQSAANEAQVQSLLAQASGKSLEVSDCVLRAPFDGEVSLRTADPGTFVRPGSSIVEVVDRSTIRLVGDVPEIDFDAVPPQTKARIHLLATNKNVTGDVARRAPSADPATRTVHFEIDLPNTAHDIPAGTTAEITIDVGDAVPATEIPLLAARVRGKTATVFVVEGAIVKIVTVAVIGERGGSLFVKRDLAPGARVVTQGRSLLANNDHVVAKLEAPKP